MKKEFYPGIVENVAPVPSLYKNKDANWNRTLTLRVDLDEYRPAVWDSYLAIFCKFKFYLTVFVNCSAFENDKARILELKELGIDIQSHGYYHHTYNNFRENYNNIMKAKKWLRWIGVDPIGYASPHGKWNKYLDIACRLAGVEYASEFQFDYLGYPSLTPCGITQIPIFPVAIELFSDKQDKAHDYFVRACESVCMPMVIYCHTNEEWIPEFLDEFYYYAGYYESITMTEIYQEWRTRGRIANEIIGKKVA